LTIFVDALDECDKNQVAGMVCFFEELCDRAREAQFRLQICLSQSALSDYRHPKGHRRGDNSLFFASLWQRCVSLALMTACSTAILAGQQLLLS